MNHLSPRNNLLLTNLENIIPDKIDSLDSKRNLNCTCPKILIVDDEVSNRMILANYCRRVSLLSEEAKDGKEAIDKVSTYQDKYQCCRSYLLILMDSNMPQMSGEEASMKIRTLLNDEENRNILIVCVTANAEINLNSLKEKEIRKIYDEIVYKPLSFDKFKKICDSYIYS